MKNYINQEFNNMINTLTKLINIPSVYSEHHSPSRPFGDGVGEALELILSIAKEMGMHSKNIDGYAGEITIGTGDYMIGILGHIDVVSSGNGWTSDPFNTIVTDDKIIGRGSSDDKGPVVSCLYAMKYLLDNNLIPSSCSIRMIIGTNEEELWKGINYYIKVADKLPVYSIVPDAYFPILYCEKGLLDFNIYDSATAYQEPIMLKTISGGTGRNIVASSAECTLNFTNLSDLNVYLDKLGTLDISVRQENLTIILTAAGKSCHAMSPEKGENAISKLMLALAQLPNKSNIDNLIQCYNKYIGQTYNGELFNLGFADEMSGKLTFNIGAISMMDSEIKLEGNLRYPASLEKEEINIPIRDTCIKANWKYEEYDYLPSVYIESTSPVFKALMDAYQTITGDFESKPLAIGGATYARSIPGAVAFGGLFPYEEELAHEANEYLSIDSFKKMTEIYITAISNLLDLKED